MRVKKGQRLSTRVGVHTLKFFSVPGHLRALSRQLSSVGRVDELDHVPVSDVAAPAEPRIFSSSSRDRVIRLGAELPYSTQVW